VLLKPQRFDVYKLSEAVEQLMPVSDRKPTDSGFIVVNLNLRETRECSEFTRDGWQVPLATQEEIPQFNV
jgi:hypothetical protein